MIISVTDTFTSLLAGFTIFAILGNLAEELGLPIDEVSILYRKFQYARPFKNMHLLTLN